MSFPKTKSDIKDLISALETTSSLLVDAEEFKNLYRDKYNQFRDEMEQLHCFLDSVEDAAPRINKTVDEYGEMVLTKNSVMTRVSALLITVSKR